MTIRIEVPGNKKRGPNTTFHEAKEVRVYHQTKGINVVGDGIGFGNYTFKDHQGTNICIFNENSKRIGHYLVEKQK